MRSFMGSLWFMREGRRKVRNRYEKKNERKNEKKKKKGEVLERLEDLEG